MDRKLAAEGLTTEARRGWWARAVVLTIALRVFYSLIAAVFVFFPQANQQLIRSNALTEHLPVPSHTLQYAFLHVWERFDTLWYLHIALHGYSRSDAVVFFPLFPWLVRMGDHVLAPVMSALLVSTVASFFLFVGLLKLLRLDYPADFAWRVLLICVAWPGSFIFFAGYGESLLFALIVWAIISAREERWWLAALVGIAAGLTKATGVVVILPLAAIALRRRRWNAYPILLTPLGILAYIAWLHWRGLPSLTDAYAGYWRTSIAFPLKTLWAALAALRYSSDLLVAINVLVCVAACFLVWKSQVRREYVIYSAGVILFVLAKETTPPLQSMMRYLLIVFPMYIGLATFVERSSMRKRFGLLWTSLMVMNLGLLWLFLGWSLVL